MNINEVFESLMQVRTRGAAITSSSTGGGFLANLKVDKMESFISVRYCEQTSRPALAFSEAKAILQKACSDSHMFNLVFVDPYHTYNSSLDALEMAENVCEDDSFIVVHDCLPPLHITGETFLEGAWSGSTFASFRDFALKSNREWFVLHSDFGVGVLGPRVVKEKYDEGALGVEWNRSDIGEKTELYAKHLWRLMRAISIPDFPKAIEIIRSGHNVIPLTSDNEPDNYSGLGEETPIQVKEPSTKKRTIRFFAK